MPAIDVLVLTCDRPAALAVTLTGLMAQTVPDLRIVVSDQSTHDPSWEAPEPLAVVRILRARGVEVELHRHLPRRGMAEHRQFLLDQATTPFVLFLDDDVLLEPDMIERMQRAILQAGCGFIGAGLIGLSYAEDYRPQEQSIEFWQGPVRPETVRPDTVEWARHRLHNAANLWHVQRQLGLAPGEQRLYKLAWSGGCVLYNTEALRACGGFRFWEQLPAEACGEDVLAQQRVMARFGGAGLLPSGAYHLELETTLPDRTINAPEHLAVAAPGASCQVRDAPPQLQEVDQAPG